MLQPEALHGEEGAVSAVGGVDGLGAEAALQRLQQDRRGDPVGAPLLQPLALHRLMALAYRVMEVRDASAPDRRRDQVQQRPHEGGGVGDDA